MNNNNKRLVTPHRAYLQTWRTKRMALKKLRGYSQQPGSGPGVQRITFRVWAWGPENHPQGLGLGSREAQAGSGPGVQRSTSRVWAWGPEKHKQGLGLGSREAQPGSGPGVQRSTISLTQAAAAATTEGLVQHKHYNNYCCYSLACCTTPNKQNKTHK